MELLILDKKRREVAESQYYSGESGEAHVANQVTLLFHTFTTERETPRSVSDGSCWDCRPRRGVTGPGWHVNSSSGDPGSPLSGHPLLDPDPRCVGMDGWIDVSYAAAVGLVLCLGCPRSLRRDEAFQKIDKIEANIR